MLLLLIHVLLCCYLFIFLHLSKCFFLATPLQYDTNFHYVKYYFDLHPIIICASDSTDVEPVSVPEREDHSPRQTHAVCGEKVPGRIGTQRTVPGTRQLGLQVS